MGKKLGSTRAQPGRRLGGSSSRPTQTVLGALVHHARSIGAELICCAMWTAVSLLGALGPCTQAGAAAPALAALLGALGVQAAAAASGLAAAIAIVIGTQGAADATMPMAQQQAAAQQQQPPQQNIEQPSQQPSRGGAPAGPGVHLSPGVSFALMLRGHMRLDLLCAHVGAQLGAALLCAVLIAHAVADEALFAPAPDGASPSGYATCGWWGASDSVASSGAGWAGSVAIHALSNALVGLAHLSAVRQAMATELRQMRSSHALGGPPPGTAGAGGDAGHVAAGSMLCIGAAHAAVFYLGGSGPALRMLAPVGPGAIITPVADAAGGGLATLQLTPRLHILSPARSLAASVAGVGAWDGHAPVWLGALVGGAAAAMLDRLLFGPKLLCCGVLMKPLVLAGAIPTDPKVKDDADIREHARQHGFGAKDLTLGRGECHVPARGGDKGAIQHRHMPSDWP